VAEEPATDAGPAPARVPGPMPKPLASVRGALSDAPPNPFDKWKAYERKKKP
jgi:hypothetical protein